MYLYIGCNIIFYIKGKDGVVYELFCFVCLEIQYYLDIFIYQVYGEIENEKWMDGFIWID